MLPAEASLTGLCVQHVNNPVSALQCAKATLTARAGQAKEMPCQFLWTFSIKQKSLRACMSVVTVIEERTCRGTIILDVLSLLALAIRDGNLSAFLTGMIMPSGR